MLLFGRIGIIQIKKYIGRRGHSPAQQHQPRWILRAINSSERATKDPRPPLETSQKDGSNIVGRIFLVAAQELLHTAELPVSHNNTEEQLANKPRGLAKIQNLVGDVSKRCI